MNIFINGEQMSLSPSPLNGDKVATDLAGLIKFLKYNADIIAIEVDGEIVPKSEWSSFLLKDNMHIEIAQFVAGG